MNVNRRKTFSKTDSVLSSNKTSGTSRSFAVVEFETPDRKYVSVVSTSWLSNSDKKCAWPTGIGSYNKLVTHAEPTEDWTIHDCSVLKIFNELSKANKAARIAKKKENLDSSEIEVAPIRKGSKKRKFAAARTRRTKKSHVEKSESSSALSSSSDSEQEDIPQGSFFNTAPTPKATDVNTNSGLDIQKIPDLSEGGDLQDIPKVVLLDPESTHRFTPDDINTTGLLEDSQEILLVPENHSQCKNFQKEILSQLVDIRSHLQELLRRTAINVEDLQSDATAHSLHPPLPVKTPVDLDLLNEWLGEDSNKTILLQRLRFIGGRNADDVVCRLLTELISNSLGKVLSLTGKGKCAQRGLSNSKFLDLIYASVRANKDCCELTSFAIDAFIKKWLKKRKRSRRRPGTTDKKMFPDSVSKRTQRRRKLRAIEESFIRINQTSKLTTTTEVQSQEADEPPLKVNCLQPPQYNTTCKTLDLDTFINIESASFADTLETSESHNIPLDQSLRVWTVENNIRHSALRSLLEILETQPLSDKLPRDPRTLMQTPACINTVELSSGKYVYFGLLNQVLKKIKVGLNPNLPKSKILTKLQQDVPYELISLSVGVDGIPVTRSTKKQFWPVLGLVDQSLDSSPFVIALFYGESKPSNLDFLDEFVNECSLLEKHGIKDSKIYSFRISRILADAPARSFIKGCKNHNSYHACEKCLEEGEWCGRVVYLNSEFNPRSDESFCLKIDEAHHVTSTPLSKLKIGLVSQVPLDYLHLVCLGVTRKLFRQWVKGKLPHRLPSRDTLAISKRLVNLRQSFPSNFQRKPRSLLEIDNFKGTEFRSLLLYTGVTCLRGIVSSSQYKLFLLFHTAMYILLSHKADDVEWNLVAKNLLKKFVRKCLENYGPEFAVYNLHGLLHINEDALNFGSLNYASTFSFESYMQKIKACIHSNNYHLEQVAKRILEIEALNNDGVKTYTEQKYCLLKSCKPGDNCFMLKSGKIVLLHRVIKSQGNFEFFIQEFQTLNVLKNYPIDSTKLGIYEVSNLSAERAMVLEEIDIQCKLVLLPYKDIYVCIPLLHSIN